MFMTLSKYSGMLAQAVGVKVPDRLIRCWLHFTRTDVRFSVETGQIYKGWRWPFLHWGNEDGSSGFK